MNYIIENNLTAVYKNGVVVYNTENRELESLTYLELQERIRRGQVFGYNSYGKRGNCIIKEIFYIGEYVYYVRGNQIIVYHKGKGYIYDIDILYRELGCHDFYNEYASVSFSKDTISLYTYNGGNYRNKLSNIRTSNDFLVQIIDTSIEEIENQGDIIILKSLLSKG